MIGPVDQAIDQDIMLRLKRIEGQVKGLQRMLLEARGCDEVVTQVLAARAALDKVAFEIISTHIESCLANQDPEKAKAAIRRAVELLQKIG